MAGGIFVDQPFHPNPKCLLFAAAIMALYWFPTTKNKWMLPVVFFIAYVAMAWYDYMYNCDLVMLSGRNIGSLDAIFKPQRRHKRTAPLAPNQEKEYLQRVYWFHVIAVAPLLIYIGSRGIAANEKLFPVVLIAGLVALAYHGFRIFNPRETS